MRQLFALLFLFATATPSSAQDVIHFVALAGIKPGKQAQYDTFIHAVTPVWKRHGMTVLARARPVGPFPQHKGLVDLAVLRVVSRDGFYAYANDPDYKALRSLRAEAVDFLTIFDGNVDMSSEPAINTSAALRVWFFADQKSQPAKALLAELSKRPDGFLPIKLGVVGRVKGHLDKTLQQTRLILVETFDDHSTGQPASPDGVYVVSGPRLH